jgi:hypothetical protein
VRHGVRLPALAPSELPDFAPKQNPEL